MGANLTASKLISQVFRGVLHEALFILFAIRLLDFVKLIEVLFLDEYRGILTIS